MVDAEQREVRPLQVGDHTGGEHRFDGAGHREVGQRHRGNRLREVERRVQRRAVRGVEQRRLQAEFDRRAQRGRVEPDVRAGPGGERAAAVGERHAVGERAVDGVADDRHHESHVERVRAEREHAAVAEEERLDGERDAHRDDRGPRAE
jgi:hypothetical protein